MFDDPRDFCLTVEKQMNARITMGIKQAMQVVLKKLDTIIEVKLNVVLKDI